MTVDASKAMLVDLFNSCASPPVARAALASIGGAFAERVRRFAEARDLSAGAFAAREVARFARLASDADLDDLVITIQGADQPVLAGLRSILSRALAAERDSAPSVPGLPARAPGDETRRLCA